jgi:hypothetical protein
MTRPPEKVARQMAEALRRYQPIIRAAHGNGVSEADTTKLVLDLLQDVFGYDKYTEIRSQEEVKGGYCDLVVRLEAAPQDQFIIEVKAIGLELTDAHVKQAIDYAANKGVDWAILTNGRDWHVYKVLFEKPIGNERVLEVDLTAVTPRVSAPEIADLFIIHRRGIERSLLDQYHARKQATNRFLLAALVLDDEVVKVIRRELKRVNPAVRVTAEEITKALREQVLKSEVVESEEANVARRRVRGANRPLRTRTARAIQAAVAESQESVAGEMPTSQPSRAPGAP